VYYRRAAFFLWAKDLRAKNIHIEMFSVYDGKCLSPKAFHNWVEKRNIYLADGEDVETDLAEMAETTVKILLCCRFERTVKAMGQVYQR
jgi:hypothetical protein